MQYSSIFQYIEHQLQRQEAAIVDDHLEPCAPPVMEVVPKSTLNGVREELAASVEEHWSKEPAIQPIKVPPGAGKTEAVKAAVRLHPERSVIIAMPTMQQRDEVGRDCSLSVLQSLDESTCRLLQSGDDRPRRQQESGHSISAICKSCPHRKPCRRHGWLGAQSAFRRSLLTARPIRWVMTTAALRTQAWRLHPQRLLWRWKKLGIRGRLSGPSVDAAVHARLHVPLLVLDEDMLPHLLQKVVITRIDVERWRAVLGVLRRHPDHPQHPEDIDAHTGLVEALLEQLNGPSSGEGGYAIEAGRAEPLQCVDVLAGLGFRSLKSLTEGRRVSADLWATISHVAERWDIVGAELRPLPPGRWHRKLWSLMCIALIQASDKPGCACWVMRRRDKEPTLEFRYASLDLPRLAASCHTLQLDATVDPDLSDSLWSRLGADPKAAAPRVLPVMERQLERHLSITWAVDLTLSDVTRAESWAKYVLAVFRHHGPGIGVLTRKDATTPVAETLHSEGLAVHELMGDQGYGRVTDVTIGHYGRHDRGTNAFEHCKVLILLGTFRIPTSEAFAIASWMKVHGVKLPRLSTPDGLAYHGTDCNGSSYRRFNNAIAIHGDPEVNGLFQGLRAANLLQGMERCRSVGRYAAGLPPVPVYLIGPEPVTVWSFPLARLVKGEEILALPPMEGSAAESLEPHQVARQGVEAGLTSIRKLKAHLRSAGVKGRNDALEDIARLALHQQGLVSGGR